MDWRTLLTWDCTKYFHLCSAQSKVNHPLSIPLKNQSFLPKFLVTAFLNCQSSSWFFKRLKIQQTRFNFSSM